jgi:CRISPR-associated protein Csm4
MKLETWKIIPAGHSGFHFGKHGMEQERSSVVYHSDSLFSALILTLATLFDPETVSDLTNGFSQGTFPFALTSAFPFAGKIRFFPLPLNCLESDIWDNTDDVEMKRIKKLTFVSEDIFREILKDPASITRFCSKESFLPGGGLITEDEKKKIPKTIQSGEISLFDNTHKRPRVAIDRVRNTSNLFHTGTVHFGSGCGLWFGVCWQSDSNRWQSTFPQILSALADDGIGGDRTTGYGQIEIEDWAPILLPDSKNQSWVTLSRYIPAPVEMSALTHETARYALDQVGGWLQSPGQASQRRKSINMLQEGSVFGPVESLPIGTIVDVRPTYGETQFEAHPVYRSGLAVGVGFSKESAS